MNQPIAQLAVRKYEIQRHPVGTATMLDLASGPLGKIVIAPLASNRGEGR